MNPEAPRRLIDIWVYLAATPLLWLATLARLRAEKGPSPGRD